MNPVYSLLSSNMLPEKPGLRNMNPRKEPVYNSRKEQVIKGLNPFICLFKRNLLSG